MAEYPDQMLGREEWRHLFNTATYTVDGEPADRPASSLTLWRGSVFERRHDWSWTDNKEVAERYASGDLRGRPKSLVWRATVKPWRLLARNTGRCEDEYVVDTRSLATHPATTMKYQPSINRFVLE